MDTEGIWNNCLSVPRKVSYSSWSTRPFRVRESWVPVILGGCINPCPSIPCLLESGACFFLLFLQLYIEYLLNTTECRVTLKWFYSWIKRIWQRVEIEEFVLDCSARGEMANLTKHSPAFKALPWHWRGLSLTFTFIENFQERACFFSLYTWR